MKSSSTQKPPLTRGKAAKLAGLGTETLRFYEKEGLLEKPKRLLSGYRQYSQSSIKRILFIKQAKELGFSLKEIFELLSLRVDPQKGCRDVKRLAEVKISAVEEKLKTLIRIKRALKKLAASCHGKGPTSECPILESLDMEKPQ